ncbi:MAG TPA: DUF4352 domain-containing protein [Methanothrix sp.]|nr:DUF4352 domain-containing protein [Methanothrix sp.]
MKTKLTAILAVLCVSALLCGCLGGEQSSADTSVSGYKEDEVAHTQASDLPSEYILINRSASLYSSIGRYTKPDPGKVFLLLNMVIENHGYSEFAVNPWYFSIIIDGVEYPHDSATYAVDERGLAPLDSVNVRNGGSTSGCLVFQIPKGKEESLYYIEYSGPGRYNFEFGSLRTEEKKESGPEPIVRDISFYIGNDLLTISKDNLRGNVGYNSFRTTVETSASGTEVNQVTKVEREEGQFVVVDITTYLTEGARPADITKAIQDAINGAEKYIPTYPNRISKGATYEATLSSGETVDVQTWKAPTEMYKDQADIACFMPDDSTLVLVVVSLSSSSTEKLFQTLEIGEIPSS